MGYSPWGHKELDTTERLHLAFTLLHPKEVRLETAEIKGGIVDSTNEYILASKAKVKLKSNSAC